MSTSTLPQFGAPLTASDLAALKAAGISESTVNLAGLRRVTHTEARDYCGIRYKSDHYEGIAIPYVDPASLAIVGWRVRRDHPEVNSDGQPIGKYLGDLSRRHVYFAPDSFAQLADTTAPAIVVEAEKSALAIITSELKANRNHALVMAVGGCWGWRGVTGKTTSADGTRVDTKGVLPDFDKVTWTGRDTIIAFDSNAATNEKVQGARRALAAELTKRGAKVRILELPVEPGINGPDDYIGKHGAAAFFGLVDAAKPVTTSKPKPEKADKPKQGREVLFEEPEPWADPVDGAELLDAVAGTFERYIALPEHASEALALWVLHAFTFEAWFASPFLGITSPEKRCGKTLLLIVVGALVPRRMFASNVTPAVLFRAIEKYKPTLLIDEADTFVRDNEELRGVLNSGHTKTTATVIRAVGDDHDPRAFSTWCAKAIALIGKLPGTLDDRAIEIRMRRRMPGEQVERLRQDRIDGECAQGRRQALRWATDHLDNLRHADPQVPAALHDRAADCWRPLLAIADAAGGTWPARAREAALALSGTPDEEAATTRLLRDIKDVFAEADDPEVMPSSTIIEKLIAIEDAPWPEWSKGKPLSPAKLARMLGGYSIYPYGNLRIGTKVVKGYRRAAFLEAWERYVDAAPVAPGVSDRYNVTNSMNTGVNPQFQAATSASAPDKCSGLKSAKTPMNTESSSAVAVPHPPRKEKIA